MTLVKQSNQKVLLTFNLSRAVENSDRLGVLNDGDPDPHVCLVPYDCLIFIYDYSLFT